MDIPSPDLDHKIFSLCFTIYNKEKWIKSILESWINNLFDKNSIEILIVFDDLKDNSLKIAKKILTENNIDFKFLFADDRHEIFCNNLALKNAKGEFVIFIQDDNWIFDKNYDKFLYDFFQSKAEIGLVGLLNGAQLENNSNQNKLLNFSWLIKNFLKSFLVKEKVKIYPRPLNILKYKRIEINRSEKGKNFDVHNLDLIDLGIYNVHLINRPFAVKRELINEIGGLEKDFMPSWGDDIDLSLKMINKNLHNYYIPFNLLNISNHVNDQKVKHNNKSKFLKFSNDIRFYNLLNKLYYNHLNVIRKFDNSPIKKVSNLKIIDNQMINASTS